MSTRTLANLEPQAGSCPQCGVQVLVSRPHGHPPNATAHARIRVFIASSSEALRVAKCIQLELKDDVDATVWTQGTFAPSKFSIENLAKAAVTHDFAIVLLTPDDLHEKRGFTQSAPRDNLLVELGLFIGTLGRERTFVVVPSINAPDLPTDLAGMTIAYYTNRPDDNLQAALGPTCTQLKEQMRRSVGKCLGEGQQVTSREQTPRRRRRRSLGCAAIDNTKRYNIVNISAAGALLETDRPFLIGEVLPVDLELEGDSVARVTARVIRVQQPAWGLIGGVGVEFADFESSARSVIEAYVESGTDESETISARPTSPYQE